VENELRGAALVAEVGFYGKLPSHGDFLRRRTSEPFVRVWDAWLQESIASSRASLGERWLDIYLTSPVWRFACAPGAAGPVTVAGVMAPSVDRVGRYFPITVVAELPPDVNLMALAVDGASFFDHTEQLVIETLETERVDLERFDGHVTRLGDWLTDALLSPSVALEPAAAAVLTDGAQASWQVPIGAPDRLASTLVQLLSHRLSGLYAPLSVWWTEGSPEVKSSCLIARGLPHPERFAALLDGDWTRHRWHAVPAQVNGEVAELAPLAASPATLALRSVAATDVGRVRQINQDAFVERPEAGMWAVADGLGGHADGEVASRMVCDALTDFSHGPTFEATVQAIVARLQQVNDHLLRTATRSLLADRCGSTVVALLVRQQRLAVLWAGDSRAYRWRDGQLSQMTVDHSTGRPGHGPANSTVTRAVGAEPGLELDVVWDEVRPGDRFLLCTDGLTRLVPDATIAEWMPRTDLGEIVEGLIKVTLEAGAPDNTTVLVVEATTDVATEVARPR
jgi:type VI secretion system protein ImpM